LRPYAACIDKLLIPELFNFYYRVTEHGNIRAQGEIVQLIQRFIQERNEEAHHRNRAQVSLFQRRSKQADLEQDLKILLQRLMFLADYDLFYVENAEHFGGRWHYRANFAYGTGFPLRQDTWETHHAVNSRRCLLMGEESPTVLDLHPFLIVTPEGRLQQSDIFFFDGVFGSGKAHFMNHHVSDYIEPSDESSPAAVASDAVNSLLSFLQKQIPAIVEEEADEAGGGLWAVEIYREAVRWAWDHGEHQSISLDALRQVLKLTREEALQQERELEAQYGIEVEPEVEVPFEGKPSWANLAYYVLDTSGQEEMSYRNIAAEAARLKDQYDPDWQLGDSTSVEATVGQAMSTDSRFYKVRRGYYRLTKHNELLSNPSWGNLAYFVLKHHDKKCEGMHVQDITRHAISLKEKYSDWRSETAQTPANTVSATMSVDHHFESLPERGYWRLVLEEVRPVEEHAPSKRQPSPRDQIYEQVLAYLEQLGSLTPLPFGRTYYSLDNKAHLMFRFSKAHHRGSEVEFFLGVTPQYFERIRKMGNGFIVFVLGSPDNVLLVPAEAFAGWVEGMEPSGSGTWPLAFYQPTEKACIERWVPGKGREDVSAFLNSYDSVRRALLETGSAGKLRRRRSPARMADLFQAGLLRSGDTVHTKKRPDRPAVVIDSNTVEYKGQRLTYNDWGTHVNGWASINVYREVILTRTD
ncbi:MAG: hypothetical protein ACXADY_27290, partial [Candidatus Hodarchaeales archaeon]